MKPKQKKAAENEQQRRVDRCLVCRFATPAAYEYYPRLREYMTCQKVKKTIVQVATCPMWEESERTLKRNRGKKELAEAIKIRD